MEDIEELILKIKKQIWENAYHIKEHHWTQIYSNLDLLLLKIKDKLIKEVRQ